MHPTAKYPTHPARILSTYTTAKNPTPARILSTYTTAKNPTPARILPMYTTAKNHTPLPRDATVPVAEQVSL